MVTGPVSRCDLCEPPRHTLLVACWKYFRNKQSNFKYRNKNCLAAKIAWKLISLLLVRRVHTRKVMHTVWVRLNAVVFFGLTVIVSLASLTWVSTIGHQGFPQVDVLRVNTVKTLRSHVSFFTLANTSGIRRIHFTTPCMFSCGFFRARRMLQC